MKLSRSTYLRDQAGITKRESSLDPSIPSQSPISHKFSKQAAQTKVKNIQDVKASSMHVLPSQEFEKTHGAFCSDAYLGYPFPCHLNFKSCAGWLICNYTSPIITPYPASCGNVIKLLGHLTYQSTFHIKKARNVSILSTILHGFLDRRRRRLRSCCKGRFLRAFISIISRGETRNGSIG